MMMDSVAGGINLTVLDEHILPIPAGDGVIPGLERASPDNGILRPADMNAVPAFRDGNAIKDRFL